MFSNSVELELRCGVCETTLRTRVMTIVERRQLVKEFDEAHEACRIRAAAVKRSA